MDLHPVFSPMLDYAGIAFMLLAVAVSFGFNIRNMIREKTIFVESSDTGIKLFFLLFFLSGMSFTLKMAMETPGSITASIVAGLCFTGALWHHNATIAYCAWERSS